MLMNDVLGPRQLCFLFSFVGAAACGPDLPDEEGGEARGSTSETEATGDTSGEATGSTQTNGDETGTDGDSSGPSESDGGDETGTAQGPCACFVVGDGTFDVVCDFEAVSCGVYRTAASDCELPLCEPPSESGNPDVLACAEERLRAGDAFRLTGSHRGSSQEIAETSYVFDADGTFLRWHEAGGDASSEFSAVVHAQTPDDDALACLQMDVPADAWSCLRSRLSEATEITRCSDPVSVGPG